jgi:alcohol dehydrogenase YqhD (iron-dependent ADH family)
MAIVFIAKTIGLQLVELVKPFVAQYIEQTFEMKRQKKLVEAKLEAKVETGEVSLHEQANANAQQQEKYRENRSARITKDDLVQMGTYEKQTHMVNYENKGTFDDFVSPTASHVKKTSVSSSFSFVWTFDFLLS